MQVKEMNFSNYRYEEDCENIDHVLLYCSRYANLQEETL